MRNAVQQDLLNSEVLKIGINLGNILLVTGKAANGAPEGVAPDMGRALADRLGVEAQFVMFASPGEVADAATHGKWDVGLIAREPQRAEMISFCDPYVEIEATYLVRQNAPFQSIDDIDTKGVHIAVSDRAAYDLFLTRTLVHATLHRAEGLAGAFQLFVDKNLDALAGLVPALRENAKTLPGSRLIAGRYTSVEQAIGTRHGKFGLNAEVQAFLSDAKASGLVAELLEKHNVADKLRVAV